MYAEDFAKAPLKDIFRKQKMNDAQVLTAYFFSNSVLINNGNWNFSLKELPWQAQLTSYHDAAIADLNHDNRPDIFLAGNFYPNNIQMGEYDADYGTILINNGKGNFNYTSLNGIEVTGEIRRVKKLTNKNAQIFILARNNDSLKVVSVNDQ